MARRNTRTMVLLYALAVIVVVVAVDVVLVVAWASISNSREEIGAVLVLGAIATAGVILLVSLFKVLQLRKGGEAVASMVGASRVEPGTRDLLERRLLNVVEEMAIAAGTRVPAVYVMQGERGINAFAAGHDVSNSVIAVTRGALEVLNRDELQGIIGHEYSHIVNGDMRLNIRMVGVLAGIVFVGAVGEFLMRSGGESRSRKDSGSAQVALVGLALMVIGYIGLFFARLIKAAVSRQREFLADASSVQFTRNPACIAGALDQIRLCGAGTLVQNRHAEDMSHMFFGQAVKMRLAGALATHPPLEERIKRVMPGFVRAEYRSRRAVVQERALPEAGSGAQRAGDQAHAWGRSVAESVALVGTLDAGNMDYARRLLDRLPPALREALRTEGGAPGAVVALLLAQPRELMEQQLAAVAAAADPALAQSARVLGADVRGLGPEFRLPVVDLALPALKSLEHPEKFLAAILAVINADRRLSLHEFVVLTLLRSQLQPTVAAPRTDRSISQLRREILLLLSVVAQAGAQEGSAKSFAAGARQLGMPDAVPAGRGELSPQSVEEALRALRTLAPPAKAELVSALFAAITADGKVRVSEAELMRVVGATLACPVPPLFDSLS